MQTCSPLLIHFRPLANPTRRTSRRPKRDRIFLDSIRSLAIIANETQRPPRPIYSRRYFPAPSKTMLLLCRRATLSDRQTMSAAERCRSSRRHKSTVEAAAQVTATAVMKTKDWSHQTRRRLVHHRALLFCLQDICCCALLQFAAAMCHWHR